MTFDKFPIENLTRFPASVIYYYLYKIHFILEQPILFKTTSIDLILNTQKILGCDDLCCWKLTIGVLKLQIFSRIFGSFVFTRIFCWQGLGIFINFLVPLYLLLKLFISGICTSRKECLGQQQDYYLYDLFIIIRLARHFYNWPPSNAFVIYI